MGTHRRNHISHGDSIAVAVVATLAGLVAVLAGCEPTGNPVPDAVLTFAVAALVTWLGASAPWWGLVVGNAVVGAAAAVGSPLWVVGLAWVGLAGAIAIGTLGLNQPVARSVLAAVVVQVALRLELDPFFTASAIVAALGMGFVGVSGWARRRGHVRKRVMWGVLGALAGAVVASALFAFSAFGIRGSATEGYRELLRALDLLESGELEEGGLVLEGAAVELAAASDGLNQIWTQPARLVPFTAQNRDITTDLMSRGADAADAASRALSAVDLDRLRIVDGRVDIEALEALEHPLAELEATVLELRDVLADTESPYLVGPLASRLDRARDRVDEVAVQAVASHAAAQAGPALLGADEERHYLLAFVNPAEARAAGGLMGNWNEITIHEGAIEITATGRTNDLERGIDRSPRFGLDMPTEYLLHYGVFGAGLDDEPVNRKYWGNVFISPDMASVGEVMAQMYAATRDRELDGVIVMDPVAIAALLDLTGPVDVPDAGLRLSSGNAAQFLTVDQYEIAESEREDLLAAVTSVTIERVLSTTLPPPQVLGAALGPAATEGHLSAWARDPDEQRLLELVGMDAAMPRFTDEPASDGLAITVNNASGNKIDSFLERTVTYTADVDEETGLVVAELAVTFTNTAPRSGFNDYVIGNVVGLPRGTNRFQTEIWTPLRFREVSVDGEEVVPGALTELGWNIHQDVLEIPSGESVTITAAMTGTIRPGDYSLVWRPQPLPIPDQVDITVRRADGSTIVDVAGQLVRRTTLSAEAVEAWRPADHPAR